MADDFLVGDHRGVRAVVLRAFISPSRFVDAVVDMGRAKARDAAHVPEEIVHEISPVAQHIDDDSAAVFAAVAEDVGSGPLQAQPGVGIGRRGADVRAPALGRTTRAKAAILLVAIVGRGVDWLDSDISAFRVVPRAR